jgi:hypothetical protein
MNADNIAGSEIFKLRKKAKLPSIAANGIKILQVLSDEA